jgi:hypothetical protein
MSVCPDCGGDGFEDSDEEVYCAAEGVGMEVHVEARS